MSTKNCYSKKNANTNLLNSTFYAEVEPKFYGVKKILLERSISLLKATEFKILIKRSRSEAGLKIFIELELDIGRPITNAYELAFPPLAHF